MTNFNWTILGSKQGSNWLWPLFFLFKNRTKVFLSIFLQQLAHCSQRSEEENKDFHWATFKAFQLRFLTFFLLFFPLTSWLSQHLLQQHFCARGAIRALLCHKTFFQLTQAVRFACFHHKPRSCINLSCYFLFANINSYTCELNHQKGIMKTRNFCGLPFLLCLFFFFNRLRWTFSLRIELLASEWLWFGTSVLNTKALRQRKFFSFCVLQTAALQESWKGNFIFPRSKKTSVRLLW